MVHTTTARGERSDLEERDTEYYLPATAGLTAEPGPVERAVRAIFHRRGEVPADSLRSQ